MSVSHSPSNTKTYFTTNGHFEQKFGFHRAVRKGPFIFVAGTTALNPNTGKVDYEGDAYQQTLAAMGRCIEAVEKLGGRREDVIRVRMFVVNPQDTSAVGEAFRENFASSGNYSSGSPSEIGAAATMIVVPDGLIGEGMLVEVEVDALCSS